MLFFIFVGHFGVIKFPFTILHPYFLTEVAQILNKICPGCKSIRQGQWVKVRYLTRYAESSDCWISWTSNCSYFLLVLCFILLVELFISGE